MFKTILNLMFRPRTPNTMPIEPIFPGDYPIPSCNCQQAPNHCKELGTLFGKKIHDCREINYETTEIVPSSVKGDWIKDFVCMHTCQNYDSYEYNIKEDICMCKGTSLMWRK